MTHFLRLMAFLARALGAVLATLALASVASAATLTVGGTGLTVQGGSSVCNYTAITESGAGNWSVTCGSGSRTITISPPVNGSVCASFTSITESGAGNWVVAGCGSLSPTITLDAPSQSGQTYLTGTAYTLKATPTVPAGRTVSSVQFFADGNLIHAGTVSGSQYVWDWSPAAGTYQVLARVTDSTAATADSVTRSMIFQVPAPPVQLYYVHPDHLGTPRAITRVSDNQVVWRWDNTEPFGNSQPTGSVAYNLRFPGQYFDAETATHYNYFRDYDPKVGRYIESDPIGLAAGLGTFGYVSANPLVLLDTLGLAECKYSIGRHTLSCQPGNPENGLASVNLGPGGLFSGLRDCRNNPSKQCQESKGKGPIPEGNYDLLKYDGNHENSDNWWRARPQSLMQRFLDGQGYGRGGGYLLHPGGASKGCITYDGNRDDYKRLNDLLNKENGNNTLTVTQ
jgi:RHS repeat-associated protein